MRLTPHEIAEKLECDNLKPGQTRKVKAPYRDDLGPSLSVTRNKRTFLFCDFGIDRKETLEKLRTHFSTNGNLAASATSNQKNVAPRKVTIRNIEQMSPLEWWEEYTGVSRDTWEVLGCDEDDEYVIFEFFEVDAHKKRKKGTRDYQWQGLVSPPLWPMPGDEVPEVVVLTEGESDCGVLRDAGFFALATTKGGHGTGDSGVNADVLRVLHERGARQIVVVSDADTTGALYLASVIASATSVGLACSYVDLSPYCDVTRGEKDARAVALRHSREELARIVTDERIEVEARSFTETLDEALLWADEDEGWLIDQLIARGTKTLIAAPAKSLKTYFTLHLLACCSTCSPLLAIPQYRVATPIRTLLVEEEGSRPMFGRRLRRVFAGMDDVQEQPEFRFRRGFNLLDPDQVRALIDYVREREIQLVILDPLQRITPGVEENSNSDMRRVWDAVNLILLEVPDVAVIVVAHNRKGDALTPEATRGAGITLGEYDLGIFLEKRDDFTRTETTYAGTLALTFDGRELPQEFTKENGAMEIAYTFDHDTEVFSLVATGDLVVSIRATSKAQGKVNENLVFEAVCAITTSTSQGASKDEVQRFTAFALRTVEKHLAKLTEEGRLTRSEVPQEKGGAKAVWEVCDAS